MLEDTARPHSSAASDVQCGRPSLCDRSTRRPIPATWVVFTHVARCIITGRRRSRVSWAGCSSLSGFYEAVAVGPSLRLQYPAAGIVSEIALDSISDVRAVPAYKFTWRLIVTTSSGETYESATSGRASVMESMSRLNDHRTATSSR